ncbi:MAG: MCP four helix bundle domain-containing protein [Cyclobacteriaceae bacterium]
MKWTYAIRQKFRAALALGIVFVLVLATHLMDKNYFTKLQDTFSSVYEDRLLAEIYIYEISAQLLKKKGLMEDYHQTTATDIRGIHQTYNDSINSLLAKYEKTKLTADESVLFDDLKKNFNELFLLEANYKDDLTLSGSIEEQHKKLAGNLDGLSEIQFLEGKSLISDSRQIIAASKLTFQLELCVLIVIGLLVQALIFASKSTRPTFSQNTRMN